MKVLVAQSCTILWDLMDCSPPGSSVLGKNTEVGLPFPSPDRPDSGIEPESSALQADSLQFELPGKPKDLLEM